MDAVSIGLGIALVVMVWLCLRGLSGGSHPDYASFKEENPDESSGPAVGDRLTSIEESLFSINQIVSGIHSSLVSLENETSGIADDLEPLRRKLHEVAKQVDHVAGHFAYVPTADIIEE